LGPTFEIDYRYNSILTVVFVTMMYSGGLPVLYPIAALFFAITYWSDKYLLLKEYRRPPNFDSHLTLKSLGWFKIAILLHVVGSVSMFASQDIL